MSSQTEKMTQPYRIRVNIITTWERKCGIANYSKNLVKSLKNLPVEVTVVYNDKPDSINPFYWVKLALKSRKNCDIIHVQHEYSLFGKFWKTLGIMSFIFYLLILIKKHYKIVTTIHEIPERMYDGNLIKRIVRKIYYSLADWFVKCSDLIIVHTENARKRVIKMFRNVNVIVIPHGSVKDVMIGDKIYSKKRLGLQNKFVLTIFGFINRRKKYEDIIYILPRLSEDTILIIAGEAITHSDKLYLSKLKDTIRCMGVEDRIIFTGYLEDRKISEIFNASDVILLPYRDITQSGVLTLALAYRKAVITSDLPTFREIRDKYDCIEIASDREDFLRKIENLIYCKTKMRKLEKKTTRYWIENNWENIAKKHFMIYGKVVQWKHPDEIYEYKEQKERLNWIRENVTGSVLEIGSATGYILNYINDKVDLGVGIELDANRVKYAKSRYPYVEFAIGDAKFLPFKNDAFDIVIVSEILEHVNYEDAKIILSEARRVGKEILITVPIGKWAINPEHKWIPNEELFKGLIGSMDLNVKEFRKSDNFIFCIVEKR